MALDPSQILYDEALRSVIAQEAALRDIRTRAAALLSAGLIAGGLFGSQWDSHHHDPRQGVSAAAAILTLLVLAAVAGSIQKPRGFGVGAEIGDLSRDLELHHEARTAPETHRILTKALLETKTLNSKILTKLSNRLKFAYWLVPALVAFGASAVT